MYHVYDGHNRITDNPVSLNWLYSILKSAYVPWNIVARMLPTECVSIENYKIVKVD